METTMRTIWNGKNTRVRIRTDKHGGISYRVEERAGDKWGLFQVLGNRSVAISNAQKLDQAR